MTPMDPIPDNDPQLELEGQTLAEGWSPVDFAAALPLFVGGDLDPLESAAVRAWVRAHPECATEVRAALSARGHLVRGAVGAASLDGVDLWPGIRTALHAEGWIRSGDLPAHEVDAAAQGPAPTPTRTAPAPTPAPLSPRLRWSTRAARSSLAAAAAILLTAGLAWVLGFDGRRGASLAPAGGAISHGSASVQFVVAPESRLELPRGVIPLGASNGPLLEEHAIDVDLGNYHPEALFSTGGARDSAALVGGLPGAREVGAREVYVMPLRNR